MKKTIDTALKVFLCATVVMIVPAISAGQYIVDYSRVYGGSAIDEGFSIDVNDEGMFVTGGRSFSSDGYVPGTKGGSDYWIMLHLDNGDTLWSRTYGGFHNDDLKVVRFNASGGIAAFGTSYSEDGDVGGPHASQIGAWLMTTAIDGELLVSRVFSGLLGDFGIDMIPMPDGGYVLLVQSTSPELEGAINNGIFDIWVARVNGQGDVQWANFYGGSAIDVPTSIRRVPGGFIITGYTESDDGDISENKGGYDYWILRLNNEGDLLWERTYGGSGDDRAYDAVSLDDGSIIVIGESNSVDGDRNTALGDEKDVWLIRLDGNGNLIWENSYGGTQDDRGRLIIRVDHDLFAFTAQTKSTDLFVTGNKGREDAWLVFIDSEGIVQQQMNYGGSLDDFVNDIVLSDSAEIYFAGTTFSNNGNVPFQSYPNGAMWVMRFVLPEAPCGENIECFLIDSLESAILRPVTNGSVSCIDGCNTLATQGPVNQPGCSTFSGPTTWYQVETDSATTVMSVAVTSSEFNKPQISIIQGANCTTFTQIDCAEGTNGSVLLFLPAEPNTKYYVLVSDRDGMQGQYRLCVTALDIRLCNLNPQLYVTQTSMGSPLDGPYLPGESVQFCYEVPMWDKRECNGIQGIVPFFGPGWDSTSFNTFGRPAQLDTALVPITDGVWLWYGVGQIFYNFGNPYQGYASGAQLAPGWYFVNFEQGMPPGTDPNDTAGDRIDCTNDDSSWKVCFTLTTKSECLENLDCSVTIKSFADGEIGAFINQACQYDPPVTYHAFLKCCQNPRIFSIGNFQICSDDMIAVPIVSTLDPPATYAWTVTTTGSIQGAGPGMTSSILTQHLVNLGTQPGTATYTVIGTSGLCETQPEEFTVTVLPQPSGGMTLVGPNRVCIGDNAVIRFTFSGEPPFTAEFAINGVVQPPVLSEDHEFFLEIPIHGDSFFSFVGMTDRNCTGNLSGAFNVFVDHPGESSLVASICTGDSLVVGDRILTFAGIYDIVIENGAANGCDSIVHVTLDVFPHRTVDMIRSICIGHTFTVGPHVYDKTGFYIDTLTTIHGCDSIVRLDLTVGNELIVSRNEVICFGDTVFFAGIPRTQSGMYFDTVALTPICDSINILHLTVLANIELVQTVIFPDTGQNSGAIGILVTGGITPYMYQWSNGATTNNPMGLSTGVHSVTVTDAVGCRSSFSFFVGTSQTVDLLPGITALEVFPNPVSSGRDLHLRISRTQTATKSLIVECFSHLGVHHFSSEWTLTGDKDTYLMPLHSLSSGVYFIRIRDTSDGHMMIRRFVVQN